MIASLMMYARPELEQAHQRYWAALRAGFDKRGIASPEILSNGVDAFSVWRAPDLVFSQTCGMPYRTALAPEVTLIGTPDYGLAGCPPGYYRSAIVVRDTETRDSLPDFAQARFAYNDTLSQSGFAALYAMAQPMGFWFETRLHSGSHLASAQMVAEGAADIAALDAVTWALICRYDGFASRLRVLCWSPPTPGLPYIAAKGAQADVMFDAVAEAIAALSPADRAALMLKGLVRIAPEAYLQIPTPPQSAAP